MYAPGGAGADVVDHLKAEEPAAGCSRASFEDSDDISNLFPADFMDGHDDDISGLMHAYDADPTGFLGCDEQLFVDDGTQYVPVDAPATASLDCEGYDDYEPAHEYFMQEFFEPPVPTTSQTTTTTTTTKSTATTKVKAKAKTRREKKNPTKRRRNEEQPDVLNGYPRPTIPYSSLISLALKNSPTGELSVSDIYSFVCENFPYFEFARSGWKNSIRHNLSLSSRFLKTLQEKPGSRKSCLWHFNPERRMSLETEFRKFTANDIRRTLRDPNDFEAVMMGKKGIPATSRANRSPDFDSPLEDNYETGTVREAAERVLGQLLMDKTERRDYGGQRGKTNMSRAIVYTKATKVPTSSTKTVRLQVVSEDPNVYYESAYGSESDHHYYVEGDSGTSSEGVEFWQSPRVSQQRPRVQVPDYLAAHSSFSLNGTRFKSFNMAAPQVRLYTQLPTRRAEPLRPVATIRNGQYIRAGEEVPPPPAKMRKVDEATDDDKENRENIY